MSFPIPVSLTVEESVTQIGLELAENIIVGYDEYEGPYTVTPSAQEQVLDTNGLMMTDDVTVNPAPSGSAYVQSSNVPVTITITPDAETGKVSATVSQAETVTPSVNAGWVEEGTPGTLSLSGANEVTFPAGIQYFSPMFPVMPIITVDENGKVRATVDEGIEFNPIYQSGYLPSSTISTATVNGSSSRQLNTEAGKTVTPTEEEQTAVAAGKYTTGAVKVAPIPSQYIVPTGTKPITANGTSIDVTQYAAVDVNVAGASQITKLTTQEFTVSTTSTSASEVGRITLPASAYTKDKIIWVHIRDKAGKRAGYFYGTDTFIVNYLDANGETTTMSSAPCVGFRYNSSNVFAVSVANMSSASGVYPYSLTSDGVLVIRKKYNSTSTLTINGTYVVDVFAIDPTGIATLFA